jgi:hypothetical protein
MVFLIIFIYMCKSSQYNFGLINIVFNRPTIIYRNRGGGAAVLGNLFCTLFIGVAQDYYNTKFKV